MEGKGKRGRNAELRIWLDYVARTAFIVAFVIAFGLLYMFIRSHVSPIAAIAVGGLLLSVTFGTFAYFIERGRNGAR